MHHNNHHNANGHPPAAVEDGSRFLPRHASQQQQREPEQYSSSESAQSNFSAAAHNQQQQPSVYEPGTGAHFMAQSGWSGRDQYGRPRQHSINSPAATTALPIFTPAPRQPHRQPLQQQRRQQKPLTGGGARELDHQQAPPHQTTFTEGPNYKRMYLVALIAVSVLFLALVVLIIVLLATKVLVFMGFSSHQSSPASSAPPDPPTPLPSPMDQPQLVTRLFECEFFILDQANQAYDSIGSFEQFQAQSIVQNALVSTFEHSSLRDLNPTLNVEKLENSGADLHIVFRLSIVILEQQNNAFREQSIKNILLSESGLLEAYLNRTNLDRTRIFVRAIT